MKGQCALQGGFFHAHSKPAHIIIFLLKLLKETSLFKILNDDSAGHAYGESSVSGDTVKPITSYRVNKDP